MTTSEMSPEQIEKDIERTREDLRQDVDALKEKLSPTQAARRGAARLGESANQAKEALMGTAEEEVSKAQESVSGVSDRISSGARGNPLAVGLGAFAVGWLISSLIPATSPEQRAARTLRDSDVAAAAVQPVADTARTVVENSEEKAKEAAREVGREAQSAVSSVTGSISSTSSEATSSGTPGVPRLHA